MDFSDAQIDRYARHLVLPEVGEGAQAKLLRSSVLVIGAGGLGSPLLLYLAAAGVGRLGVVDDDVVDLSNLQRQIVHDTSNIGLAKTISAKRAGHFPETTDELEALPGIGPYTAAAIAAIAFDRPATVVDGNVERVIARLFGVTETLPAARERIRSLAAELTPHGRPGDYAQGLMDLGAGVCRPRKPACGSCPLSASCIAFKKGLAEECRAARRSR